MVTADGDLVGVRERRREERKEGRKEDSGEGRMRGTRPSFYGNNQELKGGVEGGNIVGSREEERKHDLLRRSHLNKRIDGAVQTVTDIRMINLCVCVCRARDTWDTHVYLCSKADFI